MRQSDVTDVVGKASYAMVTIRHDLEEADTITVE